MTNTPERWDEDDSKAFLDLGRYAVPDRERQIETMLALVPATTDEPFLAVDLCCGAGLLTMALLQRFPSAKVLALDGSPTMLAETQGRCEEASDRLTTRLIDLAADDWRNFTALPRVVVSSLAIHHLDGPGKATLFRDVHRQLEMGGALIVADLMAPAGERAMRLAAEEWDRAVAERVRQLDGNDDRGLRAFQRERWNLFRYPDPEVDKPSSLFDQLRWLERAGFGAVDVYWQRAGHAIFGGVKASER